METIELSQKEIQALLLLMEYIDLENIESNSNLTIAELVQLHDKISSARTY